MPFRGVADPEARAILTTALDEYCRENNVGPTSQERDDAARLMISLFNRGYHTARDLKAALVAAISHD